MKPVKYIEYHNISVDQSFAQLQPCSRMAEPVKLPLGFIEALKPLQHYYYEKFENFTSGFYSSVPVATLNPSELSTVGPVITAGYFGNETQQINDQIRKRFLPLGNMTEKQCAHEQKYKLSWQMDPCTSVNDGISEESIDTNFEEIAETRSPPPLLCSSLTENDDDDDSSKTSNTELGKIAADGCWYPYKEQSDIGKERDSDSSCPQQEPSGKESSLAEEETEKVIGITPPSKCIMPESLKAYYNYYQHLDIPVSVLGKPHLIHTFSPNGKISLENLWEAHMKLLFRNFNHEWALYASPSSAAFNSSFLCFRDVAKVRFYCQRCMDGWTSMCGVVIFHYQLNESSNSGEIYFQIVGQKCGRCKPEVFEMPFWYPEEAQKVITNLYYDIAARVYGLQTPLPIKTRRMGQPVHQHITSLCQGCHQGLCKQDSLQNRCGCSTGPFANCSAGAFANCSAEPGVISSPSTGLNSYGPSECYSVLSSPDVPYAVSAFPFSDFNSSLSYSYPLLPSYISYASDASEKYFPQLPCFYPYSACSFTY